MVALDGEGACVSCIIKSNQAGQAACLMMSLAALAEQQPKDQTIRGGAFLWPRILKVGGERCD